ncbi:hypothetical protein ANN_12856 [Periplaneta americana]|uniref:Uncharacterized protein n=1 Tax=Periplaneta americana TaxID=6978 RepID=A0ABQ8TJX1_PERAM|nr:hypothetical protein ANN_12856 [Periplaneta americana]
MALEFVGAVKIVFKLNEADISLVKKSEAVEKLAIPHVASSVGNVRSTRVSVGDLVENTERGYSPLWKHYKDTLEEQPLWSLLKYHFKNTDFISIIVSRNSKSEWKLFLNEFIHMLQNKLQIPVTVSGDNVKAEIDTEYDTSYVCLSRIKTINSKIAFIREYPAESRRSHLLVFHTISQLSYYVLNKETHYMRKEWNPKDNYFILILEHSSRYCKCSRKDTYRILKDLWKDRWILNVVVKLKYFVDCETEDNDVFMYNPFENSHIHPKGKIITRLHEKKVTDIPTTYLERTWNLGGHRLEVTMFVSFPTTIETCDSDGRCVYSGRDVEVLNNLASYMNFEPIILKPGQILNDDSGTDMYEKAVIDLVYRKTNILFNERYIKFYNANLIEFTMPAFYTRKIVIIISKAREIPLKDVIFQYFHSTFWKYSLLGLVFCSFMWYVLRKVHGTVSYVRNFFDMIAVFITMSLNLLTKVKWSSQRFLLSSCLFFSLVVMCCFQSTLLDVVAHPHFSRDIETLKELEESRLPVFTKDHHLLETFALTSLNNRTIVVEKNTSQILDDIIRYNNGAFLTTKEEAAWYLGKYPGKLHIINEYPREYFVSYMIPKTSPYATRIHNLLGKMCEAGLVRLWDQNTSYNLQLEALREGRNLSAEVSNAHQFRNALHAHDSLHRVPIKSQHPDPSSACDVTQQPPQIDVYMYINLLHPQQEGHAAVDSTIHRGTVYSRELHTTNLTAVRLLKHLKSVTGTASRITTFEGKTEIESEQILRDMLQSVMDNVRSRADICIRSGGAQMSEVISKKLTESKMAYFKDSTTDWKFFINKLISLIEDRLDTPVIVTESNKTEQFLHNYKCVLDMFPFPSVVNDYWSKVREYPAESRHSYLLVVHTIPYLKFYLSEEYKDYPQKLWKAKDNFFILLLEHSSVNCPCSSRDVRNILLQLWNNQWILNVIVVLKYFVKCPDQEDDVLTYNPFASQSLHYPGGIINRLDRKQLSEIPTTYLERTWNLHNYYLVVTVFESFPTAFNKCESDGICELEGRDIQVLHNLATYMNFTPVIQPPGDKCYSDCSTGLFGKAMQDLIHRKTNIVFNERYIKSYNTNLIDFTMPAFYTTKIVIMVSKAGRVPITDVIHQYFDSIFWKYFLLGLLLCSFLWYVLRKLHGTVSYFSNFFDMIAVFITMSLHFLTKVNWPSQRFLLSSCLFFSIISMCYFQSTLLDVVVHPHFSRDIETLEALDKSMFPVFTKDPHLLETFPATSLNNRTIVVEKDTLQIIDEIITYKNAAFLTTREEAVWYLGKYPGKLHILNEYPREYFVSYMIPKGSPYATRIHNLLGKMCEAGLVKMWDQNTSYKLHLEALRERRVSEYEDSIDIYFEFRNLQFSFLVFIVGVSCSNKSIWYRAPGHPSHPTFSPPPSPLGSESSSSSEEEAEVTSIPQEGPSEGPNPNPKPRAERSPVPKPTAEKSPNGPPPSCEESSHESSEGKRSNRRKPKSKNISGSTPASPTSPTPRRQTA